MSEESGAEETKLTLPPADVSAGPLAAWMTAQTILLERLASRQGAVEKSLDSLSNEVNHLSARIEDSNATARLAASALDRIAKAEEAKVDLERQKLDLEKQRLSIAGANIQERSRKFHAILALPATQQLLAGAVQGALTVAGLWWALQSGGR